MTFCTVLRFSHVCLVTQLFDMNCIIVIFFIVFQIICIMSIVLNAIVYDIVCSSVKFRLQLLLLYIGPVKQTFSRKMAIIFFLISLNMCFGCSKEPSHRDGSFEYPQHMFWLRNKKNNFQLHTLIWGLLH